MSAHQAAVETCGIYHVVGTRATGERVMISEHVDLPVAEKVLSLLQSTGNYSDLFIERDGNRLLEHRDA